MTDYNDTLAERSYASEEEETNILVFSGISIFLGGFGNTFVLLLFYLDRKQLHIAHFFIISMAVSDLTEALTGVPLLAYIRLYLKKEDPMCPIVFGMKAFAFLPSLFSLVLTAIDRYWSILHVFHYRSHATPGKAIGALVVIWMASLFLGLCIFFVRDPREVEENLPCFMKGLVHKTVLRSIFWFIIPISLLVIIILYARIYHRVVGMLQFKSNKRNTLRALITVLRTNDYSQIDDEIKKRKMKEMRTTILMLITVVFFALCWLPSVVVFLMTTKVTIKPSVQTAVYILYSVNSTFNPFLYAFHISKLRKRLNQIKTWILMSPDSPAKGSTSSSNPTTPIAKSTEYSKLSYNDFDINYGG